MIGDPQPFVVSRATEWPTQSASHDLSVHQSQLRSWVKALAADPQHAFPGQGQMKPEQLEIAQLQSRLFLKKARETGADEEKNQ